ncbi:MAG: cytochrome P450, partial [Actinomycetota bacterium]
AARRAMSRGGQNHGMPTDEAAGCPVRLDPLAYLTDPDAEVRRLAAAHWWAHGIDHRGIDLPIVLGFEPTRDALGDRRLSPGSFTDDMADAGLSAATIAQIAPLFSRHGEDHRTMRLILLSAFTARNVERLRPDARRIAERLAAAIPTGETVDFVEAFAAPRPPEVFALLFGLPTEDAGRVAAWATDIALAFAVQMDPDQVAAVETAAAEMRAYGLERITASCDGSGDDLVTRLLDATVDGERLAEDDVVAMITGFLFAGSETTRRQLTRALEVLADHPADWDRLAADPTLLTTAVDEILRFAGIVPGLTRRAEEPFARDELRVGAGGRVLLSFVAANRDPDRFEDADRFVVDRPDAHSHLTFGWGPHLCVGAGLARLELAEALRALTARFEPPQIVGTGPSTGLNAPDWLRVRFTARA